MDLILSMNVFRARKMASIDPRLIGSSSWFIWNSGSYVDVVQEQDGIVSISSGCSSCSSVGGDLGYNGHEIYEEIQQPFQGELGNIVGIPAAWLRDNGTSKCEFSVKELLNKDLLSNISRTARILPRSPGMGECEDLLPSIPLMCLRGTINRCTVTAHVCIALTYETDEYWSSPGLESQSTGGIALALMYLERCNSSLSSLGFDVDCWLDYHENPSYYVFMKQNEIMK